MLGHDDEIRFIQEIRNDQDEDDRHNDQRDKGAPFHQDRLDFELGILTGFGFLSVQHIYPRYLDVCPTAEAATNASSVASSFVNSPVIFPLDMTRIRSDTAMTSFSSVETKMIP